MIAQKASSSLSCGRFDERAAVWPRPKRRTMTPAMTVRMSTNGIVAQSGDDLSRPDVNQRDVKQQAGIQHRSARRPFPRALLPPRRPPEKPHQQRRVHRRKHRRQPHRAAGRGPRATDTGRAAPWRPADSRSDQRHAVNAEVSQHDIGGDEADQEKRTEPSQHLVRRERERDPALAADRAAATARAMLWKAAGADSRPAPELHGNFRRRLFDRQSPSRRR